MDGPIANPPFGRKPLYPISHFLADVNVEAVRRLDLCKSYSEEYRDRGLTAAWFRPDTGSRQ